MVGVAERLLPVAVWCILVVGVEEAFRAVGRAAEHVTGRGGVGPVFEGWAQVVLGWPAILAAAAAGLCGIVRRQPGWLYAGAVLILGPSWYLGATPRFGEGAFLVPLLFVGAGVAVRRGRRWAALSLLVPFFALVVWLAWTVLTQDRHLVG